MKPTQVTELFANIRKTFVSFFSILMFVALGVGIFLGISWVAPALQDAVGKAYDEGTFHNAQIQFPYGLTEGDLAKLAEVEGVADVEPARQSFQTLTLDGKSYTLKVQSLGERIDTLTVMEGKLPASADEIALGAYAAKKAGIDVGDVLEFAHDSRGGDVSSALDDVADPSGVEGSDGSNARSDSDGMRYLNGSTYKVTALVDSPEYLATSSSTYGQSASVTGTVDLLSWVPSSAYDASAFQDGYPVVNVRFAGVQGVNSFTEEYENASTEIEQRITALGDSLANERYSDLHGEAQKKVDDAEQRIEEGRERILSGEKELEEGRAKLEEQRVEGELKLGEMREQLVSARAQLEEKLAEYDELKALYDQVVSEAEEAKTKLGTVAQEKGQLDEELASGSLSKKKYEKKVSELTARINEVAEPVRQRFGAVPVVTPDILDESLSAALLLLDDYRSLPIEFNGETVTLDDAARRLDEARGQLDAAQEKIDSGWSQYEAGWQTLDEKVAEGEQKLADGEDQVEAAKEQVAENEPKVETAKEQVAAMKNYSWTVMGRSSNASAVQVSLFSDITDNLSFSMAALFVIVGLLVSYSAVSRIVHEQITQIGTKKALGLRSREITLGFMAYSALAVVLGSVVGTAVGVTLVEGIIAHALAGMFVLGSYPPYFGLLLFLIVTALELVLVLGATWLACHSILREHAVELLKGEKPPEAKARFYERWGVWERLPLLTQTIVSNCMNDKRRVFSTIVGVAGCTALIVTAVTLNDDVLKSYDKHYEDVYGFNVIAYVDKSVEGAFDAVEQVFRDDGGEAARVLRKSFILRLPDGAVSAMRAVVPADDAAFDRVYHVNSVSGGTFDPSAGGAWVSQAYREHYGAEVGDDLVVDAGDGVLHKVKILGFYEYWLTSFEMVIGPEYYGREFEAEAAPNVVLASIGDYPGEVKGRLESVEGFVSASDDREKQGAAFGQFASVSRAVVLIYLALSALMAVVVLLNLNVMFIEEKKRELIVLMINGFSTHDAKRYIYNDTIVLTIIGIVVGIVLGCVMGSVTVGSVEPSTASFVKNVDWTAVAVGAVGSAALALVMSLVSLRRIPRFDLTDISKF